MKRILIVEDEPDIQELLRAYLEDAGYQTAVTGDGAAALERFGYFLGRWVYLMDAADDLMEDLAEDAFNPFIPRLGLSGKKGLSPEERKAADEAMNRTLNATAAQMLLAFQLIDLRNFGPILENVVEKGLPQVQREILFLHVRDPKVRRELKKM